ncbi:hypothetical protein [Bradyrhizobium sp. CB1015]|uniref:hypothetical protein n=1 Tax=Bradyrhizobium sp. CB1015 TaxID=2976822 RepID=UPI0021AAC6EF|nr:hypothetical protein [Bradyrhizobium sp. CB1015]UWU89956.1 hypothetical protein N2604_26140 [Bradyrhizobium sp. CB1015]
MQPFNPTISSKRGDTSPLGQKTAPNLGRPNIRRLHQGNLTGKYAQHRKNAVLKIKAASSSTKGSVPSTTPDRLTQQIPSENVIGEQIGLLCYDGQHPINFVGTVITNDILGHSRFKSNIRRSFDECGTVQKTALLKGEKVILFIKAKLGNEAGKWLHRAASVATMKTGHPELELHIR